MVQWNPLSLLPFRWFSQRSLGDVWQGSDAAKAFESHVLKSKPPTRAEQQGLSVRLAFRNTTPIPLVICWISESRKASHFYKLPPSCTHVTDDMVTCNDHIERTCLGHAFTFSEGCSSEDIEKQHLDPSTIIGGYRPTKWSLGEGDGDNCVRIVTISQSQRKSSMECCSKRPWGVGYLRRKTPLKELQQEEEADFFISVKEGKLDRTPIDTSDKRYDELIMGGWPVRCEKNWHGGNKGLQQCLEKDLAYVTKHLPKHACDYLKTNTPIYINASQKYGPKVCPVNGRGLCFHPGADWLEDNGMSRDKAECVELYKAEDYLQDRKQWGSGGVFMHELSHAYHWKCMQDGYENEEIKKCYQEAMKEKLYGCVRVHGSQGPTAKAYACTDQMEYFAELSAAFLGGLDPDEEYNKWYPFNRAQIKDHDPRAYNMLQQAWKINCKDIP